MNRRHVISEVMTRGFQGRNLTAYILYAIREQRLLGELINRSVCLCILMYAIVVAIFVHTATAQITPDLLKSVDLIARLCLAEDQKSDAGDRSEDALKRLSIKEQELIAQGLLNQIDNTISKVPANERDKVRDCLKPVRERLIEILLRVQAPVQPAVSTTFVCMGNGGGKPSSCTGGGVVNFTCAEYRAIGGGGEATRPTLAERFCGTLPFNVLHNFSVDGGECGWTGFTVSCLSRN